MKHDWREVHEAESSHEKAAILQKMLLDNLNKFLPEKVTKFTNEDRPFFTPELKALDRKRKNEFRKNRKSLKYIKLNKQFKSKCLKAKQLFYNGFIKDLKESNPKQWYSKVKRISKYNPYENDIPICQ